jgi:prepilin-type N-terminal cleavage/methylation domain-containing protein
MVAEPRASEEVRTIEKIHSFSASRKFPRLYDNCGFTLLELAISVAILSIIMIGLHQAMGTAISAHSHAQAEQELVARARYALERMVMFVQETDQVEIPSSDRLVVSERLLDTYDNVTNVYAPEGDGYLDADNDYDNLVNEGGVEDPPDSITFDLDKTDANNWKLQEQMPRYETPTLGDFVASKVLSEHVTGFQCSLLGPNLVEIQLTVNDGKNEVNLKTRVKAMYVD